MRTIISSVLKNVSQQAAIEMPRADALAQMIKRERNEFAGRGNFHTRSSVVIHQDLMFTLDSNLLFLRDDSGSDDKSRIIIFSTKLNIDILIENPV